MIVSRPLLITCFVVALAMLASAQQQPGQKKKGARAKTKSFRLRRHPHLSRSHSRSLATTSVEDEEEAWGSEVSDARELNIFLRNAASLIFDDNIVMSMSMPTTAPAVVRPALGGITGNSEDTSAPASTLSPTISGAVKDNSSAAETPEPIPLPTQPPVCAPLPSFPPNSDDIALNISITYELTILNNASLSEVLEALDASLQEAVVSSIAGCATNNSRRLKGFSGDLSYRHGRDLAITAVDSLGVVETPRPDHECHTTPDDSSNATCFVVDGGMSIYFSTDESEDAINSHEEKIATLLEDLLNDPAFFNTIPGAMKAEYVEMAAPFQSQALSEGAIEPNSTGGARLPIIRAVFLVAGTAFLGAILANRWKEKKSGDDLLRMQKLESYDSNTNTNDITATDIPYPSPDSTILGFSTDDDQGDDGEDVEENNSIDTGAAAIRSIDVESFPKYNGDSVGDLSSVEFEAADGSGNVVSVLSGLTPQNAIENKPRSVSPYCYPSFQIWPKDEDSTM